MLFPVVSAGCQRSLVNNQLSVSNFLAKSDDSVEVLFGIGRLAERNGKTDKAIEAYQSILEAHPNHASAMHRIGVIRAKQGLISEAITWMEKASQMEAPSAELIGDMGYVMYLDGDLEAAKTLLENGLRKKPDDARITNNLAIVTGALQQYSESMDLFRQHGTEAESLAAIAYVQTQSGHVSQAKQNYLKSLELDGKLEVAANGLIQIDRNATSSESLLRQPIEIAIPSSGQLAVQQNSNLPIQKTVTSPVNVERRQDGVLSKIPAKADNSYVVLTSAQSPPVPLTPAAPREGIVLKTPPPIADHPIKPLTADPLPMETPVFEPEPSSEKKSEVAVTGRLRGPAKTTIGAETDFELFIENSGLDSVKNVEIELQLGASMEIADVSLKAWHNKETNSAIWTLDSLAAGETKAITFEAFSTTSGTQTHRLTLKVNGQPVGELSLDTKVE